MECAGIQEELNDSDIVIKTIQKEQIDEIARLLTTSMMKNSAYFYVFNNASSRERKLRRLMTCMVRWYARHGGTYVIYHHAKIAGTFTCLPSKYLSPNLMDLITSRIIFLPFFSSIGEWRRLWEISKRNIRYLREMQRDFPFWHCCLLAVTSESQQFRIGIKAISIFLRGHDGHMVITTQGEKNIRYFSQFGFVVQYKYAVDTFENAIMLKNGPL
ncbi:MULTISPECIES: hypothetical protein [unclassified Flavobacterium]|uniref:hypothetical protein n=1 Tax=unclassified Flavobacterium TaxID=196869 RepID=UPI001F145C2B|nr:MULTISPECIES: hypothetical protein [unclassified Flavobacterium]UMY66141.1 hypothetical protein MKO97_01815 [Flavobacterium sp. HJ-32-4]